MVSTAVKEALEDFEMVSRRTLTRRQKKNVGKKGKRTLKRMEWKEKRNPLLNNNVAMSKGNGEAMVMVQNEK